MQVIKTMYGLVEGVLADRKDVILYKGIPIGADTSFENRFRSPRSLTPWEGIRLCDKWPDRFLQEPHARGSFWDIEFHGDMCYEPGNSENGLSLNLYAPENAEEGTLPILVFIHGGGFMTGYASEEEFNASNLAAQGVIVVLLQYRLGHWDGLLFRSFRRKAAGEYREIMPYWI